MSLVKPLARIPIGVVVERREATSIWTDYIWRPIALLVGLPDAAPWTLLATSGEAVTFYAGAAEVELYSTETGNYRDNLSSATPSVWVALSPTGREPPYELAAVTADPAEGEALTELGQGMVEALMMPDAVQNAIASFVAEHHVERIFQKRKRDRANPEALARHGLRREHDNER
jgi:hypothetical protein